MITLNGILVGMLLSAGALSLCLGINSLLKAIRALRHTPSSSLRSLRSLAAKDTVFERPLKKDVSSICSV